VALATRGPVCVLAGAGTGKTRAITYRIAYAVATGVMRPSHVLALTFTVRAAGELRGRLRGLEALVPGSGVAGVRATTFHSAALRQLMYFWPRVVGGRPPQVVESKLPLVREAARDLRMRADGASIAEAITEIEWAKVSQLHPDSYLPAALAAGRSPALGPEAVTKLYAAYEQIRRDRQLIDFEAVIELTAAILFTEPAAAREVRDQFQHFVVDEYQDVNPLQKLLLDAWLGDRSDLCVVGDPRQTIYSFTGATPAYLRSFAIDYPDPTVVRLVRDYRSTPQVVHVANQLMTGRDKGTDLVSQRPAGPEASIEEYPDEGVEAAGMASRAAWLIALGVPAREIAILIRINAHSERFEHALAEAGVAFTVRGGDRFYDRPEVKQALVLLRGAARAATDGSDATDVPDSLPGAVRHVLGLTKVPPASRGAAREKWESLTAIVALADEMAATRPEATMADFSAEIAQRAEYGHAPVADAVTISTMHAAKGLEWSAVLIPSLVEGLMPIVHARSPEAVEEERRLLYVAVTRAREHLVLSWAPLRASEAASASAGTGTGAARGRQQSRFLAAMGKKARKTASA